MNQDCGHGSDGRAGARVLSSLRLAWFVFSAAVPWIGPLATYFSRSAQDVIELSSALILPFLFGVISWYLRGLQLPEEWRNIPNGEALSYFKRSNGCFGASVLCLGFFEMLATALLSPGGPANRWPTFFSVAFPLLCLYGICVYASDRWLNKGLAVLRDGKNT